MTPELEAAKHRWQAGEALEAGRAIFGMVPVPSRPGWAAGVLRAVVVAAPEHAAEIAPVLAVADEPGRWREGHTVFEQVRRLVLKLDEDARRVGWTPKSLSHAHLLAIAELVAKVTYNATDPHDEFDEDSGWWLAVCVRNFVEHYGDAGFERDAWLALSQVLGRSTE